MPWSWCAPPSRAVDDPDATPYRPCFFNPCHGRGDHTLAAPAGTEEVEVLVCRLCQRDADRPERFDPLLVARSWGRGAAVLRGRLDLGTHRVRRVLRRALARRDRAPESPVSPSGRLAVDTFAAVALGAAGVGWGLHVVDGRAEATRIPPGDRVQTAVAALRTDDVYVPADGRRMLSEDAEQRLEGVIAGARGPRARRGLAGQPAGRRRALLVPAAGDARRGARPSPASTSSGRGRPTPTWPPGRAPRSTTAGRASRTPATPSCGSRSSSSSLESDSLIEDDAVRLLGRSRRRHRAGAIIGGGIALGVWLLAAIARAVTGRPFRGRRP